MKGKLMENMTWMEIKNEIQRLPFLVIPLGAKLKEHGLHLPMNTDYIMAEFFRDRVLETFDVLAASTIDINYFPAFTEYPGSEHLSLNTATELIYQKCKCHTNHGITHIYILNMGISTNKVLEKVQEKLKQEHINLKYTDLKKFNTIPEIAKILKQKRGTHADELETSMMLYIKPEVVNLQNATQDDNEEIDVDNPGPLTLNPYAKSGVYSASGSWGNPTLANIHKGEAIVKKYLELIREEVNAQLTALKNSLS